MPVANPTFHAPDLLQSENSLTGERSDRGATRLTPTSQQIDAALGRFGLASFRPGQREVIEAVLAGRDSLCVMPTGGGKSLCYQLPGVLLPGLTLVVSPLIALMKDQEDQLRRLNIRVTALHSNLELVDQQDRLERIARGEYDLVYAAPERFRSKRFLEAIGAAKLSLLAVDEAHCISEWGHDFRPDYVRLGWFRNQLGRPTTIALTATATDVVRRDIVEQLQLSDAAVFIRGFDRPNLHYRVSQTWSRKEKQARLRELANEISGSFIIYTSSRKACVEVKDFLSGELKKNAVIYHAGMAAPERRQAQELFMSDRAQAVVATNAFGMGIDKSDIRAVIHYNMPGTIEAYYQEAGRAGRDGRPSLCELLYTPVDRKIQEYFVNNEYPARELVNDVLVLLRSEQADPIELTRAEIGERLKRRAPEMAVGACLKILESAGAVERLRPKQNMALVRIHETGPDLGDLLPASATVQRKVLRFLANIVGTRRGEDVYFSPDQAALSLGLDRHALLRAIHELSERRHLEYVPPFRGHATRILDRTTPLDKLPIDFAQLATRKRRELDKLERVIRYADGSSCRRATILAYFGEKQNACGNCDQCQATGTNDRLTTLKDFAPIDAMATSEVVRKMLVGVRELRGRFGKTTAAQVLTGGGAKRLQQHRLTQVHCFGALRGWRQTDVIKVLDGLSSAGFVCQQGDVLRPCIGLTPRGEAVIRGGVLLPNDFALPRNAWNALQSTLAKVSDDAHDRSDQTISRARDESHSIAPSLALRKSEIQRGAAIASACGYEDDRPAAAALYSTPDQNSGAIAKRTPERQSAAPLRQSGGSPSPEDLPSYVWTWRLLTSGFDVAECCAIRGLTPESVLEHALAAARSGWQVPIEPLKRFPFNSNARVRLAQLEDLSHKTNDAADCDGSRQVATCEKQ